MTSTQPQTSLFPPIEPYQSDFLEVGDGHRLYFEQCGNPAGVPVIFLHGGPGSGCNTSHRRLLDPDGYRIVLFDQRGCGRSSPRGEITNNTTAHLVSDIEKLRKHLGIERWLVFGGSWGSSLGVAYCAQHRHACLGAILRGIFMTGIPDLDWFFNGAGERVPQAWERLAAIFPADTQSCLRTAVFDDVLGADHERALLVVRHWMQWEAALSAPAENEARLPELSPDDAQIQLAKYRVQAWYLKNRCFIDESGMLWFASRIRKLPVAIVHGIDDLVCRPAGATALQRALVGSRLHLVEGGGHSPFEAPMAACLIDAGRHFLAHRDFDGWGR